MILSPRLLKIADMVSYRCAADIGTDHAKLPIYLVKNQICDNAIASDIADGPVNACLMNVSVNGLNEVIQVVKADGLSALKEKQVETIIIAGMGGDLISNILYSQIDIAKSAKEIILQPMTHIPELRKFLQENDFFVIDEELVQEKDKIYTIIKVKDGLCQYKKDIDFVVSPLLINKKNTTLREYVSKLMNKYNTELSGLKNAIVKDEQRINLTERLLNSLENIYEITKNY